MSAVVLALIAGAVVGLAMGALGAGGGVLSVPALIYLLGFDPPEATTASLLIVSVTSLTALTRHAKHTRWRTAAVFAAAGVVPAALAARLADAVPDQVLTGSFAAIAIAAAVAMVRTESPEQAPASSGVAVATRTSTGRVVAAGAGLGTVTGMLGVGGGFLAVPTLVTALRLPFRTAAATSLAIIAANSVVALTTRLATTSISVDWAVIGPFAGAALLASWDAKRLAGKVSSATLHRVFAVMLVAIAVIMIVDAAH